MATSHKVTDKFLTCTVCMEVFTDPCTLECQHSFCKKCLISFTKTQPEAIRSQSLRCPSCRKLTKVPDPDRPVDEWAGQMKLSFMVQGLIDSFGPGTKDTKYCSVCKGDGETTPATVYCSDCDDALCERCARVHKRIQATKNHDVIGLTEDVQIKRKRKVMCKEHPDEKVEFLCKDCKKAACHKCCTLYHRKCESVVTLKSEMPSMKSTLTKGRQIFIARVIDLKSDLEAAKSKETEITKDYKQNESEIKADSQKAREVIDQKEKKLLNDLNQTTDKQLGDLKANIKMKDMAIYTCEQQTELIDHAVKSDCEMDVYEVYQAIQSGDQGVVRIRDKNNQKDEQTLGRIIFTSTTDQLVETLDNLHLGEICIQYGERLDLDATPVLQGSINVRVSGDNDKARPVDVKVLVVNGVNAVVVTDNNNKCVKSFYSKGGQPCHCRLNLAGRPWGLTQMTHNQVAVTIPYMKQVATVEVNPNLILLSTFTANKRYWGITALTPSTVAVSSKAPVLIDILDISGTVIRSLRPLILIHMQEPEFLSTTHSGNILVSDWNTKCILCLTPIGDIVFNYSPGNTQIPCVPQGVTETMNGDILVTDNNLNLLIQLDKSGQFVKELLTVHDGLTYPCGLCVDKHGHLHVCLYSSGVVKVFMFQK